MTKSKAETEVTNVWDSAKTSRKAADDARDRASHAAAVVLAVHETLATAVAKAAEAKITADEAEARARADADKAMDGVRTYLSIEPAKAAVPAPTAPPAPAPPPKEDVP